MGLFSRQFSRLFSPRLGRIIKKEFLQLVRDRRMVPIILILPFMMLVMFGYVVGADVKHLPTIIHDEDLTPASREVGRRFSNSGYFDVAYHRGGEADLRKALDSGQAVVAMIIPRGFGVALAGDKTAVMQIIVDGSDPNSSSIALAYASRIVGNMSSAIVLQRLRAGAFPAGGVDLRLRVLFNPDLENVNYMIPALFGMILMISTVALTAQAMVREREEGTLEQLIVTPIRRYELIIGKTIPYVVIGFVQITVVLVAGVALFRVPIRGSLITLYLSALLFVAASLGTGLLVSTVSKTRQQATVTAMLLMLPANMLSGVFFPLENMPTVIYWVTFLIPLRYFLVIVRSVTLKGVGYGPLAMQYLGLGMLAVVIFIASVLTFHKRLD